ncbi:MAG: hypothetical protein AAGJ18_11480, partial [Bacteroidota bacterium]
AVDYLNKIINHSGSALRDDILLYARILLLIAHYELDNHTTLDYLINAIERQINNLDRPDRLSQTMLALFKQLVGALPRTQRKILQNFQPAITKLRNDPAEKRGFIFLEVEEWLNW